MTKHKDDSRLSELLLKVGLSIADLPVGMAELHRRMHDRVRGEERAELERLVDEWEKVNVFG